MGMRADYDVCAPICHFLCQCPLGVIHRMAVFRSPVHAHGNNIRLLARQIYLALDDILLGGVDDISFCALRCGQAVR